jgi:S1-C subfamily serine protease
MAYVQRPRRRLAWLLWLIAAAASVASGSLRAHDFADSLVKLRAVAADGSQSFGSGVVIAAELLATACHVTRDAKTIEIVHGADRWVGTVEAGSLTHDLCLLSVPDLNLPAVAIRASESLQLGERVIAAGFPGGGDLAVHDGLVEGLYRYDGGNVIRTSATFETGASGGGLFDEEGALVGLLAFKARSGAKLHFALPADWALPGSMVSSLLEPIAAVSERRAFWERPRASQPPFLGHAILEAASQR